MVGVIVRIHYPTILKHTLIVLRSFWFSVGIFFKKSLMVAEIADTFFNCAQILLIEQCGKPLLEKSHSVSL